MSCQIPNYHPAFTRKWIHNCQKIVTRFDVSISSNVRIFLPLCVLCKLNIFWLWTVGQATQKVNNKGRLTWKCIFIHIKSFFKSSFVYQVSRHENIPLSQSSSPSCPVSIICSFVWNSQNGVPLSAWLKPITSRWRVQNEKRRRPPPPQTPSSFQLFRHFFPLHVHIPDVLHWPAAGLNGTWSSEEE